jgi:Dna[CI] antecedent, DciA
MSSVTYSPRYPRTVMPKQALTVMQAVDGAPTLARLAAIAHQSQAWLAAVADILPPALRSGILAGPIEDKEWCLIAQSSAVAAKLRQLSPALCAHLRTQGCEISAIRIKVQMGHYTRM